MKFHTRFTPPPSPTVDTGEETITQSQWEPTTKIDYLLRKYSANGLNPYAPSLPAEYLDVSEYGDFQVNQNKMLDVMDYFDSLPSNIRKMFDNDPAALIGFLSNPANADKARQIGLLAPLPEKPASMNSDKHVSKPVSPSADKQTTEVEKTTDKP